MDSGLWECRGVDTWSREFCGAKTSVWSCGCGESGRVESISIVPAVGRPGEDGRDAIVRARVTSTVCVECPEARPGPRLPDGRPLESGLVLLAAVPRLALVLAWVLASAVLIRG